MFRNKYRNILSDYRFVFIYRILILTATIFTFAFLVLAGSSATAAAFLFLVIAYEVHSLIKYLNATNMTLERFLMSVRYSDFNTRFPAGKMGGSFSKLEKEITEVMEEFKRIRAEKEEHANFLQTIIQHIDLGLISYQSTGNVELINNSAKKLLQISSLSDISSLAFSNKPLFEKLQTIAAGEKALVKITGNNELTQLVLFAAEFKRQDRLYKLVSIQNIQREMEDNEMEAWQKLISVLTHEIMNSITPVSSLSQTLENLLQESASTTENLEDIKTGIGAIRRRSEGLIEFVNNYRKLTRIPIPDFSIVKVAVLLSQTQKLMEPMFCKRNIIFRCITDPASLEITADPRLIEQVLINLIANSADALQDVINPEIILSAEMGIRGQVLIKL
ncbi:MAG: sensor histidine kinase, partial [Bacteroidota bacterium]